MVTTKENNKSLPDRSQWMPLLSALESDQLVSEVDEVSKGWQIIPRSLPQSGLAMLKLSDSAYNEPFYLGEIPLTTAWFKILTPDGIKAEGAAQIMDDNLELVTSLAICDAILANHLPGFEHIMDLLSKGQKICEKRELRRKAMLARTRVDFSLLDDVGDNDDN